MLLCIVLSVTCNAFMVNILYELLSCLCGIFVTQREFFLIKLDIASEAP